MSALGLPPLIATANLDVTPWRKGALDALKAIKEVTDFAKKNGTLTLTAKLAGASAAAMRAQLTAAIGSTPLPVTIAFNTASVSAAIATLRTQLNAVVSINTSGLTAVQAQINTQITTLTALIAQLRALGGSGGAGGGAGAGFSAGTKSLLADLEKLNQEYKRGDINASAYGARLLTLQANLRTAAGAATAGSAEFKALDTALTRTVTGLRSIETSKITALRTELSGARAQFDAAAAAATNLAQRQAAIAGYNTELQRVRLSLQGLAASGQLTAQQLGNVNRLLAQTAREAATINGRVNLAGLSGNIANAIQNLAGFVPGLAQVSSLFGSLPAPILASVAALGLFTAAMAGSFRTAATFQQSLKDIEALTQPTAEGLVALRDAGLNAGIPLGVGARKATAAMLELNRAGLTATEVIGGGLTGALNLAGAAGIDAAQASKLAAAAMTAFKLSAADLPAVADVFANFSNSTFLGAEDLSQAIAAVGPVARTAGLDLKTFSGIMAVLAKGGFKQMSDAGTSLKTMLLTLQAPTGAAADAINELNLSTYDASGNLLPFQDILENLRTSLSGLTEQQRNQKLRDIFGTDGIRAASILYGETAASINSVVEAQGKLGEAERIAKTRTDTYNGEVAKLAATWERFTITIGEKLLPVMTDLVKSLSTGVGALQDFANGTRSLIPYIAPLIGAFIALRGAAIAAAAPAIWSALVAAISTFFTTVNVWVASNPLGAIALAVAALGAAVNKIMQDTANTYDQIDQGQQTSFENTMKRVATLRAEGTELGRVQAQMLIAQQALANAEQGTVTGVNLFGERSYQVDPIAVEKARAKVEELKNEVISLRTEAGRRGNAASKDAGVGINPERLKEQTKALADLRKTLEERAFTLKLEGMSDVDAAVAELGHTFDELRAKAKAAFGGNLNNSELKKALLDLTKQQGLEEAALRAKFAKDAADKREKEAADAAKSARSAVLDAQRAELGAMAEGRAKRQAERDLEIQGIRDNIAAQVAELAKFPERQREVEAAGRREIAAKRRGYALEDQTIVRENAARLAAVQKSARDIAVAGMADGYAKEEALRRNALKDLQADIAERIRLLAGDPTAQAKERQIGLREQNNLLAQQNQARLKEIQDAGKTAATAEKTARDAVIASMSDGYAKEEAIRQAALSDLRAELQERVNELAGYPAEQARVIQAGNRQILAVYAQQAQARKQAQIEASKTVAEAEKGAAAAELALIQDEGLKRTATRKAETAELIASLNERIAALKGFPKQQAALAEAGNRQVAALTAKYANEDAQDAKARVERLAELWQGVADARFTAEQAGRERSAAAEELDFARRLASAKGNAEALANIEAEAVQKRSNRAEVDAVAALAEARQKLLTDYNTSVVSGGGDQQTRLARQQKFYADLTALDEKAQADALTRLKEREAAEAEAAEKIRAVRLQTAQKPLEKSADRIAAIGRAQQLAATTAEQLKLEQDASDEYGRQVAFNQNLIDQSYFLKATDEDRLKWNNQLTDAKQNQALSAKRILDLQKQQTQEARALTQSAFDLMDAEAARATRQASTDAQVAQIRANQLQIAQLRLRDLDTQLLTEKSEEARNKLYKDRLGILDQIDSIQTAINDAPAAIQERQLRLSEARRREAAELAGLGNDAVVNAQLALDLARQDLATAQERVRVYRNQAEYDAALTEAAGKSMAVSQAQRALLRAQIEQQGKALDIAEARIRAQQRIRGLADDAVSTAQIDLRLTQQRLNAVGEQLAQADARRLTEQEVTDLQSQQLNLLADQADGERKLREAQKARLTLQNDLLFAQAALNREAAGGTPAARSARATLEGITEARQRLTQAERQYADAQGAYNRSPTATNLEAVKAATEGLTGAISAQRSAVGNLASSYVTLLSQMDGVRDAGATLRQVAYGEAGAKFDARVERERLKAIQQRRDAALQSLREALAGGEAEVIQAATADLAKQQERYLAQADVLQKNGQQVTRTGTKAVQQLADQVDELGIEYDREAIGLKQRADAAQKESEAVYTFSQSVDTLNQGQADFISQREAIAQQEQDSAAQLGVTMQLFADSVSRLNTIQVPMPEVVRVQPAPFTPSLAQSLPPIIVQTDFKPLITAIERLQLVNASPSRFTPAQEIRPVNNSTVNNWEVEVTVNAAPGMSEDAVADKVIGKLENRVRRNGRNCNP